MTSQICVDASVVLKLLLFETDSEKAHALWASWIEQDVQAVAPCHLAFEVVSVIRNHVYRHSISAEAGQLAFEAFGAQDITLVHPERLDERAWELAEQYGCGVRLPVEGSPQLWHQMASDHGITVCLEVVNRFEGYLINANFH
jgi:predicted nucleic acid-binding protein